MTKTLAIALESVGIMAITGGLVVETVMGADIGFIIITTGSVGIAIGSMVFAKLWRGK